MATPITSEIATTRNETCSVTSRPCHRKGSDSIAVHMAQRRTTKRFSSCCSESRMA